MPILHWLTREQDLHTSGRAPFRLLEHVETYGKADSQNMLIQGDNLDALKALLPYYAGKVKCIYIDPPYNTKSAFEHYDDNLEHSQWLSMMYPRLELLRELLSEDGSLWVSLDDNEAHYAKVVMDEIFGRKNFVATVIWEKRTSRENRRVFSFKHDFVLIAAKDKEKFEITRNQLELNDTVLSRYKNHDNDPRGPWQSISANAQAGHATASQFYVLKLPSGRKISPPKGRCWLYTQEKMQTEIANGNIWFGKDGNNVPRIKKFLETGKANGLTPETIWLSSEVGTNDEAKKISLQMFSDTDVFDNPKPERLVQRILHIATNPGDLILDSFLGSGTTAAVAHKMGRRYIGVEIGEHTVTHCIPRLQKVISGEQGGISAAVNWQGGGGFRFYRLGDPIFTEDGSIRKDITFAQLAAHVWFTETGIPMQANPTSPLLGIHEGTACYLLYNGILGDKKSSGGNVLTNKILRSLAPHDGPKIIYGERSLFTTERLKALDIVFKQTPYDIKGR